MSETTKDERKRNPSEEPAPCAYLRTKTMYYGFNRENALSIGPECHSFHFWCVKSSEVRGPDGQLCHTEKCGPHRSCYEA